LREMLLSVDGFRNRGVVIDQVWRGSSLRVWGRGGLAVGEWQVLVVGRPQRGCWPQRSASEHCMHFSHNAADRDVRCAVTCSVPCRAVPVQPLPPEVMALVVKLKLHTSCCTKDGWNALHFACACHRVGGCAFGVEVPRRGVRLQAGGPARSRARAPPSLRVVCEGLLCRLGCLGTSARGAAGH
jgi:hypothetical protein